MPYTVTAPTIPTAPPTAPLQGVGDLKPNPRKPYCPRGAALALWRSTEPAVLICGPSGTGKSRAILEKLLYISLSSPQARILILRKTRASMGESVLQLFEDDVLPDGHYSLGGVQRERRVSYTFNNGSKIVVAGLDTATRLMSAQYDIVAIFESTEIEESDYEMLATRLRNNKTPYKQLLMDCNPDSPNHWLYRLALEGKLQYLKSQHEDNPSLTRDYLDRLSRLTGHRRERLYVGNWVSAEGAVYPDFNKCVIAPLPYIPEGRKYGGIDFGWSDPTACVAGVQYRDSDDKLKFYVYYERYKPETSINDHAIALQRLGSVSWWADPSRPDSIEALIVEGGLTVNPAENDIILGVGRISTMIATGALQISNRCTALAAEAGAYVYPPSGVGEKPATGQADHALDALRYAVMALPSSEISYYNE